MTTLAARLRKLAKDCRQCRYGYHCGQCLCCMPEEKLNAIVQEARGEVTPPARVVTNPRGRRGAELVRRPGEKPRRSR